ncbi:MAG: HAD domain-containing protein [Sulfurimicrobium sp.]|nr:HAD domain-containing protein [Sulfurimicrobium sp.]
MIIFLDFDGVLHPIRCVGGIDEPLFSRAPALWRIMRACPHVQVVFSTTWRVSYPLCELVKFTTQGGGEDLAHRFVGTTPDLENEGRYGRRDLEIRSWLDDHSHAGSWLALDDMPDLFAGEEGEARDYGNLHLVDHRTGLTDVDVLEIVERLTSL